MILNSPNNPCGSIIEKGELEALAELAKEHDIPILSDEIYSRFLYEGEHHSVASFPGMRDRTIILDGFSKTYSMTGWRLGYALLPPALVKTFDLYNVNIASCACTFSQHAAVEALRGPQDSVAAMVAEFRGRRDYLVEGLNSIRGVSCSIPGGAFYAFANITKTGISSAELAARLLVEAGVAVLSGASFGPCGEGYIRLSYAASMEKLRSAIERMTKLLGKGQRR